MSFEYEHLINTVHIGTSVLIWLALTVASIAKYRRSKERPSAFEFVGAAMALFSMSKLLLPRAFRKLLVTQFPFLFFWMNPIFETIGLLGTVLFTVGFLLEARKLVKISK